MKWLLDPGHGGMSFGEYLTPGKRSPEVPPGIYEGEFNRAVCGMIQGRDPEHILTIAPGPINIPLASRVQFVNQLCRRFRGQHVALISVHANAEGYGEWTDANGLCVFHCNNASKNSRLLADLLSKRASETLLVGNRGIKIVNHTITRRTDCPAVLVECPFMTNWQDANYMASYMGRIRLANWIYCSMKEYEAQL